MNTLKIVQLVIWSILAVILLGLLIFFLRAGSSFGFPVWNIDKYDTQLYSSSFSSADIRDLNLELTSANVNFEKSDSDEITIVCMGSESQKEKNIISVSEDGGTLSLKQNASSRIFSILPWFNSVKVTICLPEDYSNTLTISDTSGDIEFKSDFAFSNVDIRQTSGNLNAKSITAGSFVTSTTSGDITINQIKVKESNYSIQTVSGDISVNSLLGNGVLKATSGNIFAGVDGMTGKVTMTDVSGNISVSLSEGVGVSLTASCTSGSVESSYALIYSGTGNRNAYGTIGSAPYKDLAISTVSGNIRIN